jgi:hypothetical protein
MTRPLTTALAITLCAALVLALGHLLAPLLTCAAGCHHYAQEMGR